MGAAERKQRQGAGARHYQSPSEEALAFQGPVCEEIDRVCSKNEKMKAALVSLMALLALTARGEDLAGRYILQGVMEVGSELLLKPDGSFEYMLAYGAADYWAKGTWRYENNSVILNSAGRKEAPFRLLRSEAGKPGRIRVWVTNKNNHRGREYSSSTSSGKPAFRCDDNFRRCGRFSRCSHSASSLLRGASLRD